MASLKSRASNFSARTSVVAAGRAGPLVSSLHDGRLSKIDETTGEAGKAGFCEACPNKDKEISEDDMTVNEDISKSVIEDQNLKSAYNEFRNRKGLSIVDFDDLYQSPHQVRLCMDCLLDCFQARRADVGDCDLDEVSAYRNTLMHGIGMKQDGRYPRKQGDEMGIQRKRAFMKTHHGLSEGFKDLALPSNAEIFNINMADQRQEQQANDFKQNVKMASTFYSTI